MKQTFKCDSVTNDAYGKSNASLTQVISDELPKSTQRGFLNIVGDTDGFPIKAGEQYDIEITDHVS
jgi:hypothetical protein